VTLEAIEQALDVLRVRRFKIDKGCCVLSVRSQSAGPFWHLESFARTRVMVFILSGSVQPVFCPPRAWKPWTPPRFRNVGDEKWRWVVASQKLG
jgi:hypothetical protein